MSEPMSMVAAVQDFFSKDPHGRKVTIPEYKALSDQDKLDLWEMLVAEGYNVKKPDVA